MPSIVNIRIKGGRLPETGRVTHGQDVGVFAVIDGKEHLLPVSVLVLRCDGRSALATVDLRVDEIDITSVTRLDGED